jgi:hypothetical protein
VGAVITDCLAAGAETRDFGDRCTAQFRTVWTQPSREANVARLPRWCLSHGCWDERCHWERSRYRCTLNVEAVGHGLQDRLQLPWVKGLQVVVDDLHHSTHVSATSFCRKANRKSELGDDVLLHESIVETRWVTKAGNANLVDLNPTSVGLVLNVRQ